MFDSSYRFWNALAVVFLLYLSFFRLVSFACTSTVYSALCLGSNPHEFRRRVPVPHTDRTGGCASCTACRRPRRQHRSHRGDAGREGKTKGRLGGVGRGVQILLLNVSASSLSEILFIRGLCVALSRSVLM